MTPGLNPWRPFALPRFHFAAALLLAMTIPPVAQATGQPPDPGFTLEVRGGPPDIPAAQFRRDVLDALPAALLDPARNVTQADGYRADGRYRMVMLFHRGEDKMPTGELCRASTAQKPPVPPADLKDLRSTTHLVAAFCENDQVRAAAHGQTTGETSPQQASFRFLVTDVAKQLFPSGFNILPGAGAAAPVAAP
jgi:hypothetical protein